MLAPNDDVNNVFGDTCGAPPSSPHLARSHARPQRSAWYSYFDDAHAILFLAPISCFDELLAEDRRVNRLEDSFLLWKGIVQSKLLAKCLIVRASLPRLRPRLS